jgi:predicted enzyme related to lactoylglutathione lyase
MFKNTKAFSSFSVDDMTKAKDFYGNKLGLSVSQTPEGLDVELGGGAHVFIYQSDDYNPPEHTVLNFVVDDVEKTVGDLKKKGIAMEHYDMPNIKTDDKGIFRGDMGPAAIAWFKDPAGHILSVLQE